MSAPTTHDPRFVNTRDGVCWERRAVTDSGLGLYAVEGSCKCPPFKMATLAELAEHGIVGSADVLPMPVGPKPRTLDTVEDELTGVSLSLYEEERASERLRWALAAAKRGRARLRAQVAELEHTVQGMVEGLNGHDCPPPGETPLQAVTRFAVRLMEAERLAAELEALELGDLDGRVSATCAEPNHPTWLRSTTDERGCPWCRVAELEATTDDGCSCPPADHPHQVGCPLDGVGRGVEFAVQYPNSETVMKETVSRDRRRAEASLRAHREVDAVMWRDCRVVQRAAPDGPWVEAAPDAVTQSFAPVAALREVLDGEHYAYVHHEHRTPHDLPELGGAL